MYSHQSLTLFVAYWVQLDQNAKQTAASLDKLQALLQQQSLGGTQDQQQQQQQGAGGSSPVKKTRRESFRVYTRTDEEGSYSSSEEYTPSSGSASKLSSGLPAGPSSTATSPERTSAHTYGNRVILTTYPGQVGIHPIPMNWGSADPLERGPIVASRHPSTIKKRNATGAHGGSYSVIFSTILF